MFDVASGRAIEAIKHSCELTFVGLNQAGLASDRKLVCEVLNGGFYLQL